jgi:hypothetical protein
VGSCRKDHLLRRPQARRPLLFSLALVPWPSTALSRRQFAGRHRGRPLRRQPCPLLSRSSAHSSPAPPPDPGLPAPDLSRLRALAVGRLHVVVMRDVAGGRWMRHPSRQIRPPQPRPLLDLPPPTTASPAPVLHRASRFLVTRCCACWWSASRRPSSGRRSSMAAQRWRSSWWRWLRRLCLRH